jgi:peptidoglycan glycosyltransferase
VNTPILRLSRVVALLFAALLVSSTLVQFVQAPALRARADNKRTLLDEYSKPRGLLLVGESAIAKSTPSQGELAYLRSYPQGPLYSHVTGYYSYLYGAAGGLEGAANGLLSGSSDALFYRRVADLLSGRQATGASLSLTLNPKAQDAASKALGGQRGAVVALNPKTGAVLALVSKPEYDPNTLASHDLEAVTTAWKSLNDDPTRPLADRRRPLPARLDLQARHRCGGPLQRGLHPELGAARAGQARPAADQRRSAQPRQQAVRTR